MEEGSESLSDFMICDSGSRLVSYGFTLPDCVDKYVLFVSSGDVDTNETKDGIKFVGDAFYDGGEEFRTNECIIDGGDYPSIYRSARVGNFRYKFQNLPPAEYFVDLHFTEIININGPKGLRVFNVFIQEDKVLSDFDIFAVVGANKPIQLVDSLVLVKEDGAIVVRFEGINGSRPLVSGICIRRAPKNAVTRLKEDFIKCQNCASEIEVPSAMKKLMRAESTAKYEKKIQELTDQCQHKRNECYEAWMSLSAANGQLEKVGMELDIMTFKTLSQDQVLGKQAEELRNISSKNEHEKARWTTVIDGLEGKIKIMKNEHSSLYQEARDCVGSIPELNKMVYAVQALVDQCEIYKMKYNEEQAKRKKLFNEVQEARGNIRVFCRCRPLNKDEIAASNASVVDFDAAKDGLLGIQASGSAKKSFKFDRVYTPKDDQDVVFDDAAPMVISVLDGYNVCIFAYGQTGTGKTFTMEGTEKNKGVNYRTLHHLFEIANERSDTNKYDISVSVLEVYNEHIRDLLASSPTSKKLEIKQDSKGFHNVLGIIETKVDNIKEVWTVLQAGSNARAIGSNNVNEHSSRSHCLLCITVRAKNLLNGECTKSKLWLVDLAGSERLAKINVQGERLKEAKHINRSLSALGDVISALASKNSHIPYRNSKLTHLLQDSLGGDSKTLMFVQISPSDQALGETLSSLNFATRVRGIELGDSKRQIDASELLKCKLVLDKARQESRSKDEAIKKLEESVQILESKTKGKNQMWNSQQEKIKELEELLELQTNLHDQSKRQASQLTHRLKESEETSIVLQRKIKELEDKLSSSFQQKVNDLENKLKHQILESESLSGFLNDKVKELERKLKAQEQDIDSSSSFLHQKIKELEENLQAPPDMGSAKKPSRDIGKLFTRADEFMDENNPRILGSSNSLMKREFRSGDAKNNVGNVSSFKIRKFDPPKFERLHRAAAKPNTPQIPKPNTPQVPLSSSKRTSRDQGQVLKERDNKNKLWLR